MSKGIIIVDMPESCDMCKMGFQNEYYDRFECFLEPDKKLKNPEECKPDWCPIQPKRKRLLDIAMEQDDIDVSEKKEFEFACVNLNDLTIQIMNKAEFSKKFNKDVKDAEWNDINPILDSEMEKKQIEKFKGIFREVWNYKQVDVIKYNAYIEEIVDCCQDKNAKEFYRVFKM